MKIKKGHTNWLMNNIINLMQLHIYELVRYISQAVRIDRSYKQSCKHIQAVFEPRDVLTTSSVLREDARTATAANMNITTNGSSSWNCYSLINQVEAYIGGLSNDRRRSKHSQRNAYKH